MAEINLTQAEADALIAMPKLRANDSEWDYPTLGQAISIPLVSMDRRESFLLDISRGRIDLKQGKYQNRGRQVVVLARLDIGGPPHRNPDGVDVPCPHFHLYREGFGTKWAMPVPADSFPNISDMWQTLRDFMVYCNVTTPPVIKKGLFT